MKTLLTYALFEAKKTENIVKKNSDFFDKLQGKKKAEPNDEEEADDLYQTYLGTKEGWKNVKLAKKSFNGKDTEITEDPVDWYVDLCVKHSGKKVSAKVKKALNSIVFDSFC